MPDDRIFKTLLILALPASGKSEARRFMLHAPADERARLYHLGDTPQLDDFPYVHYMREVDDALAELGHERVFYEGVDAGFAEGRDWGTLLRLTSGDYAVVTDPSVPTPRPDADELFSRIDQARADVGAPRVFAAMDPALRKQLAGRLKKQAARVYGELFANRPESLEGRTLVIEFARGGPEGASMPLEPPHGYRYSLAQLSPEVLSDAAILYIWVSPEESRRKNVARADPNDPGSSLHHSAPESVMRNNYGCDDMEWLLRTSGRPDTIKITAHGRDWLLPVARFDNRDDKTSFVRSDPATWSEADKKALHDGLTEALQRLWKSARGLD